MAQFGRGLALECGRVCHQRGRHDGARGKTGACYTTGEEYGDKRNADPEYGTDHKADHGRQDKAGYDEATR